VCKKTIFVILSLIVAGCISGLAQEGTASNPDKKAAAKPPTEKVAESGLTVEAELCTGIAERMPTGMADSFPADIGQVYLWCRVLGAQDSTIIRHVWYYNGEQMATVELPVKSSSWRTWSSKSFLPEWVGAWEVKILDTADNVLLSFPFRIVAAPAETDKTE
jgi:hypothetical protein